MRNKYLSKKDNETELTFSFKSAVKSKLLLSNNERSYL